MDEPEDVVVDMLSVGEDPMRVGRIVAAETPARPFVIWDAGGQAEEVRVGGSLRRVPYGGLRYLALVAPEQLAEILADRPVDLFVNALHAEGVPGKVDARRLKKVLIECGLDAAAVDRAWTSVSKHFAETPGVHPSGDRGYHPDRTATPPDLGRPARQESFRIGASAIRHAETAPKAPEAVASGAPSRATLEKERAESAPPGAAKLQDLKMLLQSDPTDDELELAARAKSMRGVQDTPVFRAWIASPAAIARHLRAVSNRADVDVAGLIRFTDRVLENPGFVPEIHGVGAIAALRSESPTADAIAAASRYVDALAKSVRRRGSADAPDSKIASAVSWLPWASHGGRSGLIAALASAGHDVVSPTWWSGFTWSTLLAVGDGSIGSVLRQEKIAKTLTAKVLSEGIAGLNSRAALAEWIAAPRIAFELADLPGLRARIADVVENDTLIADAFAAVRREHKMRELQDRVLKAEQDAAAARASAETAVAELAVLEAQRARLDKERLAMLAEDRGARANQLRQAKLDGVRAAAQILATVSTESEALSPEQLASRLAAIAGRAGIAVRGKVGATVEFDPVWCDAPGIPLGLGDRCIVVRPAYEYVSDKEAPVLLFKATVRAG